MVASGPLRKCVTLARVTWHSKGAQSEPSVTELRTQLHNTREVHDAQLQQARAEAKQECSDKFLLYGYSEEAFQRNILGKKARQHADEK